MTVEIFDNVSKYIEDNFQINNSSAIQEAEENISGYKKVVRQIFINLSLIVCVFLILNTIFAITIYQDFSKIIFCSIFSLVCFGFVIFSFKVGIKAIKENKEKIKETLKIIEDLRETDKIKKQIIKEATGE